MLSVQGLTKWYKDTLAVDQIDFKVESGEILGLLGPNGAGKTTILRSISGIIQPNSGRILIAGKDLSENSEAAKRELAFVPEVPSMFDMLTVLEHLRFVAMAYNTMDKFENRAGSLLKRFDLEEKKDSMVASLSKGMKQKLAVACAFVHESSVLLFDEPLIGIDPKGARELKDMMIFSREAGCSILVSTHMLDTAERLCDRILIMDKGRKVAEGTLAEIHERAHMGQDASLEDMFLRLTEGSANESASVPAG